MQESSLNDPLISMGSIKIKQKQAPSTSGGNIKGAEHL